MAIVHINGFGSLPVIGDYGSLISTGGTSTYSRVAGRYNGYAIRHSNTSSSSYAGYRMPTAAWTDFSLGVAINHRGGPAGGGGTQQFGLQSRIQTDLGGWSIAFGIGGSNVYLAPASVTGWTVVDNSVTGPGWHWWNWVFKVAATGGICRIYRDGVLLAHADGDTLSSTGAGVLQDVSVWLGNENASSPYHADVGDLILRNDSNIILDSVVTSLFPDGNSTSAWVGSDGNSTDNYALINENPTYDSAGYVGSGTLNALDTYTVGNLPNTASSVHAVQVGARAFKSDAGARTMQTLINAQAGTATDPGGGATIYQVATTSDGSAAWNTASVNAMTTGVRVTN